MGIAIAGWRLKLPAHGRSRAGNKQRFAGYDLGSYGPATWTAMAGVRYSRR